MSITSNKADDTPKTSQDETTGFVSDPHVIDENMNFQSGQPLSERLPEAAMLPEGLDTTTENTYFKAGFTITDLLDFLPPSRQVNTNTVSVIGWVFEFPPVSIQAKKENSPLLIADIKVTELRLRPDALSRQIIVERSPVNCKINPKIFISQSGITPNTPITYESAYDQLTPYMTNDPGLHISRLEGYKNWAELAFLSRTSLDLMRILLEDPASAYNQFFFSGAHSNFINLYNPEYSLRSKNFVGKHTKQPVPSTSPAFTLKAEPFVKNLVSTSTEKNSGIPNDIARDASSTGAKNITGDVSSLPIIPLMDPCPDIWIYEGGLQKGITTAEPDMSTGAKYTITKIITGPNLQSVEASYTIPGSTFPAQAPPLLIYPLGRPDLFDRLRDVYRAIKHLFTGGRDNSNT